jgi:hypothetical protein
MPSYVWSCHACATPNAPSDDGCVNCGCPALASARDITVARARREPPQPASSESELQPPPNYARTHARFWRWFLALSIIYPLAITIYNFVIEESTDLLVEFALLTFELLFLVPLYGYVTQRPLRPKWLWIALFWLSALSAALAIPLFIASPDLRFRDLEFVVPMALVFPYRLFTEFSGMAHWPRRDRAA